VTVGPGDSGTWEVPLSALEHHAYCDRQTALIHVEGVWAENADTVRGDLSHQNVDLPGLTRRAGVTVVRSLPVASETYGLRGVCASWSSPAGRRRRSSTRSAGIDRVDRPRCSWPGRRSA